MGGRGRLRELAGTAPDTQQLRESWSRIEPGAVTGAAWCRSLQALAMQQT